MKICEDYSRGNITSKKLSELFVPLSEQIVSIEDKELRALLESIPSTFDILWFANGMDILETEEGKEGIKAEIMEEVRTELMKYIDKISRLIIHGNINLAITENERAAWWKKQKERGRDEFCRFNGYYEGE
jgi:hypothetical protein